jgi:hypothetical protein
MSNYRFDERSEDEFKRDIRKHTIKERELFFLWLDLVERETGNRPNFRDTGCGKNGEFLEDKDVSTDADFDVEGYGSIEVKFSKPMLTKSFHLKVNQVKAYHKKNVTILMVNGCDEPIPTFTILKPDSLENIMKTCKAIAWRGFGGKQAYSIPVKQYIWRPLK